jgi:hypothetical protein
MNIDLHDLDAEEANHSPSFTQYHWQLKRG